ncbi:MAG: sigma-70 family RNA polymerase sigma factor [Acidimicrobiales bacterium]|nr:sigma-70 family RNA polymerase sigma factor [Acidimicrobiales bacterium]
MRRSLKRVMEQSQTRGTTNSVAAGSFSFADMYDAHVEEVYRFVHRRCHDHALSEDITQETFMSAIRSTDDPSSLTIGWLVTVARNRLLDVLRRQVRYERKLRLVGVPGSNGYDDELAERLRINGALNELSVDHRLVLTLHYFDGLTVPALAEYLGRSVKSVEGLVTRARRELRTKLDEGAAGAEGAVATEMGRHRG